MTQIKEILTAYVLGKSKEFILAHPEARLTKVQNNWINNALLEFKMGKPLAYILRNKEFYGRNYLVTQDTLIPRPETELLIELSLAFIISCGKKSLNILEIGSGSGCIPITLAAESNKNFAIDSIDISQKALEVAKQNSKNLLTPIQQERIKFINTDVFKFESKKKYQLIVSNPPYITEKEYFLLDKNIINYEPSTAFLGGADGLNFYRRIKEILQKQLTSDGVCLVEINSKLAKETEAIFLTGWNTMIFKDLNGLPRVISISRKPYRFERYSPPV